MSRRGRLDRSTLIPVLLSVLALNQLRVAVTSWGITLWRPGFADFGNYYLYARVGLHQGWSHLYEVGAQHTEWVRMGGAAVIPWFPIIYPPPLAWIAVPFSFLPLPLAFAAWSALLVGCVLAAWRLLAPLHPRVARWTVLAGMLAIAAIPYALLLGQILIIELAAVAIAWRLLIKQHDVLAGIVLVALVFKPQVAFLVPVVLLVIGRWRAVAAWAAGSAVIVAIAVITTGLDGLHIYLGRLGEAAAAAPQFFVPTQLTIAGFLGRGPLTIGLSAAVIALALVAAWRNRGEGPGVPIACALVGSMLVTPYVHAQDLATLLLAGGLAGQSRRDGRWIAIFWTGYALLLAISYWGFGRLGLVLGGLLLTVEAGSLVLAALAPGSGHAIERPSPFTEIPLDRSA